MNKRFLFSLVSLAALAALSACTKQSDIDTLYARMNQNERQMQTLSSQVGNVEQVLPGQADMWAQMQAMRQELNALRGQVDELTVRAGSGDTQTELAHLRATSEQLEVAVRQMASELGLTIEALNTPATAGQYTDMQPTTRSEGIPSTSSTMPAPTGTPGQNIGHGGEAASLDTATTLYDAGMKAFSDRKYRDAIKAFDDFTQSFPKHKLTSNAHFWKGESHYQAKDYAGAALAYQQVLEKFPGSSKFQSAMLKQGMAFYYAGKKDAAKLRLEELIKKYPSSAEAGRAKKFLKDNK